MKKLLIRFSLWMLKKLKYHAPIDLNTIITFRNSQFYVQQVDWTRNLAEFDTLTIRCQEVLSNEICYTEANNDTI